MSGKNTQTETHSTAIESTVSPWLTPLAYFLFSRIILPAYFGKIEVQGTENIPQTGQSF
jgi:1-acyl-sn-glycerol-3-phosphate acyltransferase